VSFDWYGTSNAGVFRQQIHFNPIKDYIIIIIIIIIKQENNEWRIVKSQLLGQLTKLLSSWDGMV